MRAKRAWFESECCEVNNRTWKPVLLATFWPKHKVNFQPPPPKSAISNAIFSLQNWAPQDFTFLAGQIGFF